MPLYYLLLDKPVTGKELYIRDSLITKKPFNKIQLRCDAGFAKCKTYIRKFLNDRVTVVGRVEGAVYPTDYLPIVMTMFLIEKE
jgi:hypothetical protein